MRDELKAADVVAPPCDEDGVARFIEQYIIAICIIMGESAWIFCG